jgi:hypothetical protein
MSWQKRLKSRAGAVLVDDSIKYQNDWENRGGTFVLRRSVEETLGLLRDLRIVETPFINYKKKRSKLQLRAAEYLSPTKKRAKAIHDDDSRGVIDIGRIDEIMLGSKVQPIEIISDDDSLT